MPIEFACCAACAQRARLRSSLDKVAFIHFKGRLLRRRFAPIYSPGESDQLDLVKVGVNKKLCKLVWRWADVPSSSVEPDSLQPGRCGAAFPLVPPGSTAVFSIKKVTATPLLLASGLPGTGLKGYINEAGYKRHLTVSNDQFGSVIAMSSALGLAGCGRSRRPVHLGWPVSRKRLWLQEALQEPRGQFLQCGPSAQAARSRPRTSAGCERSRVGSVPRRSRHFWKSPCRRKSGRLPGRSKGRCRPNWSPRSPGRAGRGGGRSLRRPPLRGNRDAGRESHSNTAVSLYLAHGLTRQLLQPACQYYTLHVPLVSQIQECSAGILNGSLL